MDFEAIRHVLLSQLTQLERPDLFSYRVTRRAFLSSGALIAAPAAAAIPHSETPDFTWIGQALRISIGGSIWLIDPDGFAGPARLILKKQASEFLLSLTGARLAGTSVRVDFSARIYRAVQGWLISFTAPLLALVGEMRLRDWLDGGQISRPRGPQQLSIGGQKVRISQGQLTMTSRQGLTLTIEGESVSLTGKLRCRGDALILTCRRPNDATSLARLAGEDGRRATRFEIANPKPARRGTIALAQLAEYRPSELTAVAGEAFEGLAGRNAAFLVEGGGTLTRATGIGDWGKHLRFDRSALFLANGSASVAATLTGGQRVTGAAMSARLAQHGNQPITADFPARGAPTLDGKLRLDRIWVPVAEGARVILDLAAAPASVALGSAGSTRNQAAISKNTTLGDLVGEDASEQQTETDILADARAPRRFIRVVDLPRSNEHLYDETEGDEHAADANGIALDEARIILRRDEDNVNLEFQLIGFKLRRGNGRPFLSRVAPAAAAKIIVEFQPQHTWETVHEKPVGCTAPTKMLSDARMSRPARIAFQPKENAWKRRTLNVEDLTDWDGLDLIVHDRAKGVLAERLDRQLELPGIVGTDTPIELFRKVARSLSPPGAMTTALEMAPRLFFSPAEALVNEDNSVSAPVAWLQQGRGRAALGQPLWNVRLNEAGRKSVRAIWSSYLKEGTLYQGPPELPTKPMPTPPRPPVALTPTHHWEIVGQTSVYGLPALRRLEPKGDPKDPVVTALKKIPRGGVIRPRDNPTYLTVIDGWHEYKNKDTGIALATPFDDADITLTGLGGIFRARWEGEPAQLRPDISRKQVDDDVKKIAPTGFSLEQLTYQTWLGRDIRVVAITKGYLFPLGVRAAFVEVAERRFYPDVNANNAPVSFEVRRQFIRCRPDPKTYPGLNQPYRSRDFPAQSVTMRTLVTPDLAPPGTTIGDALIRLHAENPPLDLPPNTPLPKLPIDPNRPLFWPRFAGSDNSDLQFQWTTDSEATASSPLIFVDSTYAGLERVMELLARYYYPQEPASRRTARFFGARQRYAPDNEEGHTSFDTDNWVLEARGQIFGEQGNKESFVIDGRMQGADQPPFYPVVAKAQVMIQSLDRLLGAPQGLISVAFHDKYRTLGFGDPKHPSDIYLRVLGPRIALDVTDRSQTSGGLASPTALVAAISRQTGIVGGKEIPKNGALGDSGGSVALASTGAERAQKVLASEYEGGFEFSQAELGKFDPIEYFGFKDAKLLGILDLKDVIKAALSLSSAPRLIETITYGALEDVQGLERIKRAASTANKVTNQFFNAFAALAKEVDDLPNTSLTLKDLYPDLVSAVGAAQMVLSDRFKLIENAKSIDQIGVHAMAIMSAARPLLREIDRLARDPIPQAATAVVTQFIAYWETVGSKLTEQWKIIAQSLLSRVAAELSDAVCSIISAPSDLEGPFFGASATITCSDFLANPDDLVANSRDALFKETFALPLSRLLTAAGDMQDVLKARFALAQDSLRAESLKLLNRAVASIERRLAPPDVSLRDIRDAAVQVDTARAIAAALAAKLDRDFAASNLDNITNTFVVGLEAELRREIGKLLDAIHPLIPPVPPVPPLPAPETAEQILADVESLLIAPLRDAAIAAVADEAKKIKKLIKEQVGVLERQLMARIGQVLSDALADLLASAEFARIAKLGRSINGLCDQAYLTGRTFTVGVLKDLGVLEQDLLDFRAKLIALTFDTLQTDVANAAQAIRSELLQLLSAFRSDINDFTVLVATVPPAGSGCAGLALLLDPARRVLIARKAMIPRIGALADALAKLRRIVGSALGAEIKDLTKGLVALLGDISSINKLESSGVLVAAKQLTDMLPINEPYRKELENQLSLMKGAAGTLRASLADGSIDASQLPSLSAAVLGYVEGFDQRIAALVLQSAALTSAAIDQWEKGIAAATRAAADVVFVLHHLLRNAFETLLAELEKSDTRPFVEFVLGTAAFDRLQQAIAAIVKQDRLLGEIRAAATSDRDVITKAKELHEIWGNGEPAVASAVAIVGGFIEDFLSGNLANSLAARIREVLRTYARQLRDMLTQFVPTKIETGYDWDATINSNAIFKMSDRTPDSNIPDLRLSVKASVDIVSGKRELSTSGTLQSFELMLLPDAHMATIKFAPLVFESRNGSSPDFNLKISGVEIGPLLTFLEPLRAFMSPQGNGFYITPTFNPLGIEAGFQFGSALIQVGSLSFQNVFIRVAAWLPFGRDPAKFTFAFASDERPFLISSPPYGGGGYVLLTAEPGGNTYLELSFVFGGVAALKFGPLNAQGRIVAGIGIRTLEKGTTLWAIFEAFGEGSIACFSVSVCLRVTVWHYPDGEMVGQTRYSFAFKLGFIKYRYGVTARYQLKSGKGQKLAAPGSAQAMAPIYKSAERPISQHYRVLAPRKESDWAGYRRRIDSSLI